jgi:hypothetical protein
MSTNAWNGNCSAQWLITCTWMEMATLRREQTREKDKTENLILCLALRTADLSRVQSLNRRTKK